MMFNRRPVTPVDVMHYPLDDIRGAPEDVEAPWQSERDLETVEQNMERMEKVRTVLMDDASINIMHAQETQTKNFNARRKGRKIEVGDLILVENTAERVRVAKSLAPKYFGPYQVTKVYENGTLKIKNPRTGKHLKAKVPAARASHYRLREQFMPSCKATNVNDPATKVTDDKPELVDEYVHLRHFAM